MVRRKTKIIPEKEPWEKTLIMDSHIHSEAEFWDIVKKERSKLTDEATEHRFRELAHAMHQSLARQDSEMAITLMTRGALALGSSDIHYDVGESVVTVRLRIDGSLVNVITLSHLEYKLILERIKYKSNLKLNLTTVPQDGKYRVLESDRIDVRVSTLPVRYGENIVCRILDSGWSVPKISELGLQWTAKRQVDHFLKEKSGMILVTGPTGSGKTTTLYAMLETLNAPDKKVITLEDPIEYELLWVVQSEVNDKTEYTYTNWLRAILRQDPDVIMVGEIRDLESATIAMQAAMTWQLVLSSLHTKSAAETVERLMNMGIASYILSSGLDIIIAQRLVRKLCPNCLESHIATPKEIDIIKWMMKDLGIAKAFAERNKDAYKLYTSKWCPECGMTGYRGRIGIYEVLAFNDEIRTLVREWQSPVKIMEAARQNDFILMREDGIMKAMQGKTSLEEIFRVID